MAGSVALLSDALESLVDIAAALPAFFAVWLSEKPADAIHPFGRSKAEYLLAVAEGAMIVLATGLIFRETDSALYVPRLEDQPVVRPAINLIAGGINASWAFVLIRAGRSQRSPAISGSGRPLFKDVVTSVGVIVGLLLAIVTGHVIPDPILAILVALNILREGWRVMSDSAQGLMDAAGEGDHEKVRKVIDGR